MEMIMSPIIDSRIGCENFIAETTIEQYLKIAPKILDNNKLQRKKVRSSKSVYSLLKDDLKKGCVIPPLVIAIMDNVDFSTGDELLSYIYEHIDSIIILDGLQRTYTLIAAKDEMEAEGLDMAPLFNQRLRLEIYTGINKFGILYRMLTLNTGQTPMTTRHQIEMLYGSLVDKDTSNEIRLVSETEGKVNRSTNEFKFSDAIDGFTSYLYRDELPVDRQDILEYIDMLSNLSNEDKRTDLFISFITTYSNVMDKLQSFCGVEEITPEDIHDCLLMDIKGNLYGTNIVNIFNTPQAMCGFGAAIGHLKNLKIVKSFNSLLNSCDKDFSMESNVKDEWLFLLLYKLDQIKREAKKIGNSQRIFFQFFFRQLFNSTGDSYLVLDKSVNNSYKNYLSQV
jgi:hypothetical protein